MKLYVTEESKHIVRRNYKNILPVKYTVIDVEYLKIKMQYRDTVYFNYLLSERITKIFQSSYRSVQKQALLYIIKQIDTEFLSKLNKFIVDQNLYFTEIVLIDFSGTVDQNLYGEFTTVI